MMKKGLNTAILLILLPLIMSVITHFGYISSYTKDTVSIETFNNQYESGIYKYRVLSRLLIIEIDKILSNTNLNEMDNMLTRIALFMDNEGKLSFYFSYFILNSIFFILATVFFYLILRTFVYPENDKKIFLSTIIFVITVPIFQFVLTPYDYSSFFFNNLIIYLLLFNLKRKSDTINILMLFSIILATLNRETTALSIAFIGALLYTESKNMITVLKGIFLPALAFISAYLGLRFYYGFDSGLLNKFTLHLNFISPLNLFGLITGIVSVYLFYYLADGKATKRALTNYLIFSIPYILVSLMGGITYEIRLWTPILINLGIILLIFENRKILE